MTFRDGDQEPVQPPAKCPACGGGELTTTSKVVDRDSYWRCLACGEVWNLERRSSVARSGFRR
jgi:transposase-like protein